MPRPSKWLVDKGHLWTDCYQRNKYILDYGCGKSANVNPAAWDCYDPYYRGWDVWHRSKYHAIVCNYVLCVLPREKRLPVLKDIQARLTDDGVAYISVRNDKPKQGWGKSSRGTYQGRVHTLKLPLLYECAGFRIYTLTKTTKLV